MAKRYLQLSVNLKKLLFSKDMKPVDLARELNIPQPTIHRLVTGKSTRPYKSSLEPIAGYFSLTVAQLLGENPMPDGYFEEFTHIQHPLSTEHAIKTIPVLTWEETTRLSSNQIRKKYIVTTGNINSDCFALISEDYSMEPLFPRSTILVFDPHKRAMDRSYVLVKLIERETPIFRQLLIDVDHQFLKPLNPDSSIYQMRVLGEKDKIIACLLESRINHEPDDTNNILLEDSR